MQIDFKTNVFNLMQTLPFINSVMIITEKEEIVYSTENWDRENDANIIISSWSSMKAKNIIISEEKYVIRHYTNDRLLASSVTGKGHIIGVKENDKRIIALIEPDGVIPFAFRELIRLLGAINTGKVYYASPLIDINAENNQEKDMKEPYQGQISDNIETGLPFTARLMAHYRALEYKSENPLIADPFAERLAGDLTSYLNDHIRFSEMDYPIVRSYYIEEKLLTPWCKNNNRSQIILLGAGLDTRAYRFKPLQKNVHTIFEIDFPVVNRYKDEILKDQVPYCEIIRLYTDLSKTNWSFDLIKRGFSKEIPTFWVLEGLAYYMEKEAFASLLSETNEISSEQSQIFVDIMHASRWVPFPYTSDIEFTDPYSTHVKWGLNIQEVPAFFAKTGWAVTCVFADDFDQGRNVGQKGMIFVNGVSANL
ncbi:MAG: class I SAM-dependent methyltransferase [Promethearchaeota archaeon]